MSMSSLCDRQRLKGEGEDLWRESCGNTAVLVTLVPGKAMHLVLHPRPSIRLFSVVVQN